MAAPRPPRRTHHGKGPHGGGAVAGGADIEPKDAENDAAPAEPWAAQGGQKSVNRHGHDIDMEAVDGKEMHRAAAQKQVPLAAGETLLLAEHHGPINAAEDRAGARTRRGGGYSFAAPGFQGFDNNEPGAAPGAAGPGSTESLAPMRRGGHRESRRRDAAAPPPGRRSRKRWRTGWARRCPSALPGRNRCVGREFPEGEIRFRSRPRDRRSERAEARKKNSFDPHLEHCLPFRPVVPGR